jgi:DHA1 family multidrug resistance protein-like MFS transporter
MYEGIGINYGNTLIGAIAVVLVPLPFIFYFFGKKIRAGITFAPTPDIEQEKKGDEEGNVESKSNENGSSPP